MQSKNKNESKINFYTESLCWYFSNCQIPKYNLAWIAHIVFFDILILWYFFLLDQFEKLTSTYRIYFRLCTRA